MCPSNKKEKSTRNMQENANLDERGGEEAREREREGGIRRR
jgi:hypothetical protein